MLKRAVLTWGATLLVLALTGSNALSAPVAQPQTYAQTTIPPTPTPVAVDTFDPAAAGGRTVVKWYVGLGTGTDPKQIDVQRAVVDQFNKSQQSIYLTLQIVGNSVASARGSVPNWRSKPNWMMWSGANAGLVASFPRSSTVSCLERSRSVSKFHSLP